MLRNIFFSLGVSECFTNKYRCSNRLPILSCNLFFRRAAFLAACDDGRPRFSLGNFFLSSRRTAVTALRICLLISLRIWNSHTWWPTPGNIRAKGSGYKGEPSVVTPSNFRRLIYEVLDHDPTHEDIIRFSRIVVENLIDKTSEVVIIHNRQYAERPIVQFISGNIAGEISQRTIKVFCWSTLFSFFFPSPRPSFES